MSPLFSDLIDKFTPILGLGLLSFAVAMLITPVYTSLAYKHKWWQRSRSNAMTGEKAVEMRKLHGTKLRRRIPTMAGVIMLAAVTVVTVTMNLSGPETYLPLAALLGAGLVGLLDDIININSRGRGVAGLNALRKILLISFVALLGGMYFYYSLGFSSVDLPFLPGRIELGALIIPVFAFVVVASANAVNITDGLDGLAGGLLSSVFTAYGVLAFIQDQFALAAFCITLVGVLLAYTWFNIFPARFFMGDVGSFAMGATLGVVAMLTDTLFLLPIFAFVFVAEAGSSLIQVLSKRMFGKKVFKIAPLHHHFEAIGWPEAKVTMRFWIIGQLFAAMGIVLAVVSGGL